MFLRVTLTVDCYLQQIMLPGIANGLGKDPRPFTNTVRTPTDESVWGITPHSYQQMLGFMFEHEYKF